MEAKTLLSVFLVLLLFLIPSAICSSVDWPMFRHDASRSGYSNVTGDLDADFLVAWTFTASNGIFSSPAAADLNNDGRLEIIVGVDKQEGSPQKSLIVLGSDGKMLWELDVGGAVHSSPSVYDLDDNGDLEIITGTNNGRVIALNGKTGKTLWSLDNHVGAFRSSPLVSDVDFDNNAEVIIGSSNGSLYCIDGESGIIEWTYPTGGEITGSATLIGSEIVFGSGDGYVYALDGSGNLKWKLDLKSPIVYSTPASLPSGGFAIGTDDGRIALVSDRKIIKGYETNGSIRGSPGVVSSGTNTVIMVGSSTEEDVHGSYVKLDVDRIYAVDQKGKLLWEVNTGDWAVFSSPAIADVDGDSEPEAVIGSRDGKLRVIDCASGTEEWSFLGGTGIYASPVVADVDGDESAEIVIAYRFSNQVKMLDSPDKPDLVVTPISFSEYYPDNGDIVNVTVFVGNRGKLPSNESILGIYLRTPVLDTLLGNVTLPSISPGGSANATFAWKASMPPGEIGIYALADFGESVDEASELNNGYYTGFYNDLFFTETKFPEELKNAKEKMDGEVSAMVFNKGRLDINSVDVALLLEKTGEVTELNRKSVAIGKGKEANIIIKFSYTPSSNITQNLSLVIDPDKIVPENDESNNAARFVIPPFVEEPSTVVKTNDSGANGQNPWVIILLLTVVGGILWAKVVKPKLSKKGKKKAKKRDEETQLASEEDQLKQAQELAEYAYNSTLPDTPVESSADKPVE